MGGIIYTLTLYITIMQYHQRTGTQRLLQTYLPEHRQTYYCTH